MKTNLRKMLEKSMQHFLMADRKIARRQGVKLIRAKGYLHERGIAVADPKSKLVYKKSMGMFSPAVKSS